MGKNGARKPGYFEDFARKAAADAPSHQLLRGMAMNPGGRDVETAAQVVSKRCADALATIPLGSGKEVIRIRLKELLESDLKRFLRPDRSVSMLDALTPGASDDAQIARLFAAHGVDVRAKEDREYLFEVFEIALNFLAEHVLDTKKIHPDISKVHDIDGIYNIVRIAQGNGKKGRRMLIPLACALLRIAVVVDYMKRDQKIAAVPLVQEKLRDFEGRHIRKDGNGTYFDPRNPKARKIPLARFELRQPKEEWRVIMKLLHKPRNRTDEVLDHLGFLAVTHSPADVIALIHYLFFNPDTCVFPRFNIRADQTNNKLIKPESILAALTDAHRAERIVSALAVTAQADELEVLSNTTGGGTNPNSSAQFRVISTTFDMPIAVPRGPRILFPLEAQFVDLNSFRQNQEGETAHAVYVERQREEVRGRVVGNNILERFEED